jgi:hypothetical protein
MDKIKIRIITMGNMPREFNKQKIFKWKSDLFCILDEIQSFTLPSDSDGVGWEFTDDNIKSIIPIEDGYQIRLVIVNIPLEDRFYARRLNNNTAIITFNMMKEILQEKNIPLENLILRVLYAYSLLYLRCGKRIPEISEVLSFTHDETRGCIYDMTGIKTEIIYSTDNPILCESCYEKSKEDRVSIELLNKIRKELEWIRKPLYYRIIEFVTRHPVLSILISAIIGLLLGIMGNILSNIIWELWLRKILIQS